MTMITQVKQQSKRYLPHELTTNVCSLSKKLFYYFFDKLHIPYFLPKNRGAKLNFR